MFFHCRRAVQTKRHLSFRCKGVEGEGVAGPAPGPAPVVGRCVIESKSRKSCKQCRFQRCLRAGMSVDMVMNEEERRDRMRVRASRGEKTDTQPISLVCI